MMTLKEARKKERYSQQQVADYMGISRPTYKKLEENPELLTVGDAKKLSVLLKVDPQDIFFGENCN